MLQAFVDDSAAATGDRRLVLAGYVNTADRWITFSETWDAALQASPAIEYLSTSEAYASGIPGGQFNGWTDEARDNKLVSLAGVIRTSGPWSIECSVSRDEYWRYLKPENRYGIGNPYFGCFYGIVITLARLHRNKGLEVPVDIVFDEQAGMGDEAALFYDWVKATVPADVSFMLGSKPIFRDDRKVMPLQAADMLAWHLRREREFGLGGKMPDIMSLLCCDKTHHFMEFTTEMLKTIAEEVRAVPGGQFLQKRAGWRKAKREVLQQVSQEL